MKFLLVLAVVFIAVWLWRKNRRDEIASRAPPKAPPAPKSLGPQEMTRCALCGLHLPATDALPGPAGVYCSEAHRQQAARG